MARLRGRRGNALMLVLILFMVISILSLAMLGMAAVENTQVIAEEKIDEAYYTARAVVQATSDWIGTHFNERDQMEEVIPERGLSSLDRGIGNAYTLTSELNGKTYDLSIWRDETDADVIYIKATAYVEAYKSTVQMSLQETIAANVLFEDAIYSEGPFGKSSGNANLVVGSVATGSLSIPDNLNVDGAKTVDKHYTFFDVTPPSGLIWDIDYGTVTRNDGEWLNDTPNRNVIYDQLTINDTVYVKNTDDAGNPLDVHILVDDLNVSYAAIIQPEDNDGGRIFIYCTTNIFCDKKFGVGGDPDQPIVYIICNGSGSVNFSGNPFMNLYLYGPDVDVEYGGTTVYYGALIANVYGWNGNINVYYRAPEDLDSSPFSTLNGAQEGIQIADQTWYGN